MVMGHEFMGVEEEGGPEVTKLKKGDRVVVPFVIACGQCFFANRAIIQIASTPTLLNTAPKVIY